MARPALEVLEGGHGARRAQLEELYARYGGAVFGRCRYLVKDAAAAEDLMQDVFARALTAGDGFRGEASALTWLLKIATHLSLNALRSNRAAWREQVVVLARVHGEADPAPHPAEARDLVRQALAGFDLETQAAAVHYFVDEMTLDEVAVVLGRSVPTIRKRLETFQARTGQRLREVWP